MNTIDALGIGVIQRSIRPGGHVKRASGLDDLLRNDSIEGPGSEPNPSQLALMIVAIKPIVLPIRNLITKIKRSPRRANWRIHDRDRVGDSRLVLVSGWRPAIVRAGGDHVQLVVVTRPILGGQEIVRD